MTPRELYAGMNQDTDTDAFLDVVVSCDMLIATFLLDVYSTVFGNINQLIRRAMARQDTTELLNFLVENVKPKNIGESETKRRRAALFLKIDTLHEEWGADHPELLEKAKTFYRFNKDRFAVKEEE